jgi:hypothetical protein
MRWRHLWIALLALAAAAIAVVVAIAADSGQFAGPTGRPPPSASRPEQGNGTPPASLADQPCGWLAKAPAYRHVIWIWLENKSYRDIIGSGQAPYLNGLTRECGLATNYRNVSHPSLPNYLAATSGLARSVRGLPWMSYLDCAPGVFCGTAAASVFAQGETWHAYEESMPSNCYAKDSGEYAVRHNPPPYYTTLPGCADSDVPYSRLATDLADRSLPAFSFVTPNLIDDMHDGTVAEGDTWLRRNLPAILTSPQYADGTTAIFITWDEGNGGHTLENCVANASDQSCHVPTLVISPSTPAGARSGTLFNHYSLLGTTERLLGLPLLGSASRYPAMTSAFNL